LLLQAQLVDKQQQLLYLQDRLQTAQATAEADGSSSTTAQPLAAQAGAQWDPGSSGNLSAAAQQQQQAQRPDSATPTEAASTIITSPTPRPRGASRVNSIISGSFAAAASLSEDVLQLRRDLGQAEQLLRAYQAENEAAAKRIKVSQLPPVQL
jgi:hypothetical protein